MDVDLITQYIISLAPSITAIITSVAAIIVAIFKVKNTVKTYVDKNKDTEVRLEDIENNMNAVLVENAELKKELKNTLRKMNNVEVEPDGKE